MSETKHTPGPWKIPAPTRVVPIGCFPATPLMETRDMSNQSKEQKIWKADITKTLNHWLTENRARRAWSELQCSEGTLSGWEINGRVIIILDYDNAGWDAFIPVKGSKVDDALEELSIACEVPPPVRESSRDCTVIEDAGTDEFSDDLPIQGPKTSAEADSGMERLTIEIKTGNAAFKDKPNELADILRGVSDMANPNLPTALTNRTIFDSNGNRVGRITIYGRH